MDKRETHTHTLSLRHTSQVWIEGEKRERKRRRGEEEQHCCDTDGSRCKGQSLLIYAAAPLVSSSTGICRCLPIAV